MSAQLLTSPAALALGVAGGLVLVAGRLRPRSQPRRIPVRPVAFDTPTDTPSLTSSLARARRARIFRAFAAACAFAVAGSLGMVPMVVTALMLALRPSFARRSRTQRHRRAVMSAMPEALDLVIVSIEAGHLPLEALRLLHPVLPTVVGGAFAEVVARVDRGERFAFALRALPERLGPSSLTFVDAIVHTERAGLAFGPAVQRLADDAREHRRRLAEAAARELPIRLSFPLVLCTLPSFVLVAIVPLLIGALSSVRVH